MKLKRLVGVLAAITVFTLFLTVGPVTIFADTTSFDGWLTTDNTFIRPDFDLSAGRESYNYFVRELTPSVTGSYDIVVTNCTDWAGEDDDGPDPAIFLYEGSFDPGNPTANLKEADDDNDDSLPYSSGPDGYYSALRYSMTAGSKYIIVMSSFNSGDTGHVYFDAIGPGTIGVADPADAETPGAETPGATAAPVIPVWVRNVEMTCYQVWINEDNEFEFVFFWEYKDNNWVKIYDMVGNEVFSIDMKKGSAHFEADLPDGFYTVKTFHNGFETPLQEFLIGKP